MPFSFTLSTTSFLDFQTYLSSSTHPSLPQSASNSRGVLRNILKSHKRLPLQAQASNLSAVLGALYDYIPYLLALDNGLSGRAVSGEEVEVTLTKEIEVEWRPTLASSMSGRDSPRARGKGLDYEIFFVLTTLASVYSLLARVQLHVLHSPTSPTSDQRTTALQTATKHLLSANSVHTYLLARSSDCNFPTSAVDIASPVQQALASLSLAEATLLFVLKDDPYVAATVQERNKNDKDWMIKAPDLPKVRAHLFARLCMAVAEHATKAAAMLDKRGGAIRVDDGLLKYIQDLRRVSRAKACRFLGVDADLGGKTGEAIAWLRAGKKELGIAVKEDDKKGSGIGFSKLKKEWNERREDKKVEKGSDWGGDAGKYEEGRVLDWLEAKWVKMNDTVSIFRNSFGFYGS